MFNINTSLQLIRSIIYFWVAIELIMLAQLYWYGNMRVRNKLSKIILALFWLFTTLAGFFLYIALLPIIRLISVKAYLFSVNFLIIFIIPVLYSLQQFRKYTLKK